MEKLVLCSQTQPWHDPLRRMEQGWEVDVSWSLENSWEQAASSTVWGHRTSLHPTPSFY